MKSVREGILGIVNVFFDKLISNDRWLNYAAAALYRSEDAGRREIFERQGLYLLRRHYFLPIPDDDDIRFQKDTELPGLTIDERMIFETLSAVVIPLQDEFRSFALRDKDSGTVGQTGYVLRNGTFMAVDGNYYYALIRHEKPRRIIEVGAGNSTLLAAAAIRRNRAEGHETKFTVIDPYPTDNVLRLPEIHAFHRCRVQEVDISVFNELSGGDILFIDSSHTVKAGGDVWWEICEMFPRLASGVFVHVHDIYLPKPYPSSYMERQWYWMEQYFLQAFLAFNNRFTVIWPGNYMFDKYPERIRECFSEEFDVMSEAYPDAVPSSLWMRVT